MNDHATTIANAVGRMNVGDVDGYIAGLYHPHCAALEVEGIAVLRFEGDRVAERWNRLDDVTLMTQLGLLPAAVAC